MTTRYMHLLDGKPAFFDEDDGEIYFRGHYHHSKPLTGSLRQIKREQTLSHNNRLDRMGHVNSHRLDYVRVKTDD